MYFYAYYSYILMHIIHIFWCVLYYCIVHTFVLYTFDIVWIEINPQNNICIHLWIAFPFIFNIGNTHTPTHTHTHTQDMWTAVCADQRLLYSNLHGTSRRTFYFIPYRYRYIYKDIYPIVDLLTKLKRFVTLVNIPNLFCYARNMITVEKQYGCIAPRFVMPEIWSP